MSEIISSINEYIKSLSTFWQAVMTVVISMVPVIELRGAIPIAAHAGLPWHLNLAAAVVGNMIPVPFILLFIRKVFKFLRAKTRLGSLVTRLEKRAEKNMGLVHKFEIIGLAILVAIPLPGTGAWTGALVAALMDLRMKTAIPSILIGVIAAGIIMTLISYGVIAAFA